MGNVYTRNTWQCCVGLCAAWGGLLVRVKVNEAEIRNSLVIMEPRFHLFSKKY
jgi:hypothetical protein